MAVPFMTTEHDAWLRTRGLLRIESTAFKIQHLRLDLSRLRKADPYPHTLTTKRENADSILEEEFPAGQP